MYQNVYYLKVPHDTSLMLLLFLFFFNIYFYLFTYLAALGLGCDKQDLFSCGMWELVP